MPRPKKQHKDTYLSKMVGQIGKMIRYYREEAALSQNKLAKVSGVSVSTINEIENCVVSDVRLSTIMTLAYHLEVDPIRLMTPSNFELSEDEEKDFKEAIKVLNKISVRH